MAEVERHIEYKDVDDITKLPGYSLKLAQDMHAIHGLDARAELIKLLTKDKK